MTTVASSQQTFPSINPATGETITDVVTASTQTIEQAIQTAKQALVIWSAMTGIERGRILQKAANLLREHNDELAYLEAMDTGKPLSETLAVDIQSGADCIEYYASVAANLQGQHIDLGEDFVYTRREPLGICAGIGAWNYPIQIACWKSAPALACGNVMLFKPSELTPLTAPKLAEIFKQAGLPDGVFTVLQGDASVGEYLAAHADIAKVSVTGSVSTGKKVMQTAAQTLKAVTMELGGKSPLVIFDDANIEQAVQAAMLGNFYTQGEICSNGTRVFVHQAVQADFLACLREKVANIKIGNPLDPATQFGALISEQHLQRVLNYIELGQQQGATLFCGGKRMVVDGCEKGFFVEPTVFTQCHDDMQIVREEIFGPVMSVLSFNDEQEVIERANNTNYGLAAGVFTQNLARAHRVAAKLQAGTCWINAYNVTPVAMPFGGYKQSGLGRENGLAAIEHYTQLKSVYVGMGNIDSPY